MLSGVDVDLAAKTNDAFYNIMNTFRLLLFYNMYSISLLYIQLVRTQTDTSSISTDISEVINLWSVHLMHSYRVAR